MNVILDYICEEIAEIEEKIRKDGKLSMSEIEYLDKLEHIKKDRLTSEAMEDSGYSNDGYDRGYSGRRYANRDSMGRYTSRRYSRDEAKDEVIRHMEKLMGDMSGKDREIVQDAVNQLKTM